MTTHTETQAMCERIRKLVDYYDELDPDDYPDSEPMEFTLGEARALSALLTRQQETIEDLQTKLEAAIDDRKYAWSVVGTHVAEIEATQTALRGVRGCLKVIASNGWVSAHYARNFAEQALDTLDTLAALQAKP